MSLIALDTLGGALLIPRQGNRENRALSRRTLHRNVSIHLPREITADRKAKPSPLRRVSKTPSHLNERLEDRIELVSLDEDIAAAIGVYEVLGERLALGFVQPGDCRSRRIGGDLLNRMRGTEIDAVGDHSQGEENEERRYNRKLDRRCTRYALEEFMRISVFHDAFPRMRRYTLKSYVR